MSIWQTLDIAPTEDESEIRRAYARQLKKNRPDTDPTGYQRLREAFDDAKRLAKEGKEKDPQRVLVDEPAAMVDRQEETDERVTVFLPEREALYTEQEISALAYKLVNEEISGIASLKHLSARINGRGSLEQQRLFSQRLAAALAEQAGLTEAQLDIVAEMLNWRIHDYDFSHIIPLYLQHAINHQIRQTEILRAWQKMEAEGKQGSWRERLAIKLLRSERPNVPFWIRLLPGLIETMATRYQYVLQSFPEILPRLNPFILQFLQRARLGLTSAGLFLLAFWGFLFSAILPSTGGITLVSTITIATLIFYLYVSDMVLISAHSRPRLLSAFLGIEFLLSLIIIQWFFGGLYFAALAAIPTPGLGPPRLMTAIFLLLSAIAVWAVWPNRKVPAIRLPGIIMSRLFSSPWRILEVMNFAWYSFIWLFIHYFICAAVMAALINQFSER